MAEKPFQNREILEMFKDVRETLGRVEEQTKKTNGRVTRLERAALIILGAIGAAGLANPDTIKVVMAFVQ